MSPELPQQRLKQQIFQHDNEIALYLNSVFENGDYADIITALAHVANARGMTQMAKGLTLDKPFNINSFLIALRSLGLHVKVEPKSAT